MTKDNAIKYFLKIIYENKPQVILSKSKIQKIEKFYKNNYVNEEDFNDFINQDISIKGMLKESKSAWNEIKKQFFKKEALQPGIISECFYSSTLAKLFNLENFLDIEESVNEEIPINCLEYINKTNNHLNGRYLYYNKDNYNTFIIQYGNPTEGDAVIVINGNKIKLEYKEKNAKAGEYDVLYNENGKLIITPDFKEQFPELALLLEKFNREKTVMELVGHNYKDLNRTLEMKHIERYFKNNQIDVLISVNKSNEFIAITDEIFKKHMEYKIISTVGSEIRTSGRNPKKVFTNNYYEQVKKEINAIKVNDDKYNILKNEYILTTGRGKKEPTRLKFGKVFFIKTKDIEENDYYVINTQNVKQLIPTISIHIKIIASFNELKDFYEI